MNGVRSIPDDPLHGAAIPMGARKNLHLARAERSNPFTNTYPKSRIYRYLPPPEKPRGSKAETAERESQGAVSGGTNCVSGLTNAVGANGRPS